MNKLALLIAVCIASLNAIAADQIRVTKLRTGTVTRFDAPRGAVLDTVERDKYVAGSWALVGEPQAGWVEVSGDGRNFWVKNSAIDTDRRIASSADCGARIAGLGDKIAATRALGEECKSK